MMMYPHLGNFTGFWGLLAVLLGLFLTLLLVAAIVILIIWLVRKAKGDSTTRANQPSARELLAQRYARGEINHDEFIRMKDDLDT